ncbi:uncharacterized protein [Chelonus insularis]|uniref:uncharacterized protein n=1 Tax=Chelonus insularis TaxID=460826 RepID=UPI00158EE691|nr:uncharacterized protein LOC118065577 [Chelonus insularis]
MKSFYIFLLLVSSFTAVKSKNISREISFDDCDKDSWWMKNISVTPSGSLINFEANITLGEKNINLTSVKFSLTGCSSNFTCLNHTNLFIEGLNCTNHSTNKEKELCSVLKTVEHWTKNSTLLMTLRDNKQKEICIPYKSEETKGRLNFGSGTLRDLSSPDLQLNNKTYVKI